MSTAISARNLCHSLAPRLPRRVFCSAAQDFEQRTLDVQDATPLATSTSVVEPSILVPGSYKPTDDWVASAVIPRPKADVSPVPLPADDEAEEESQGFGASLMQSAPVRYYMYHLETNPVLTKSWTSFTGFFLGDIIAQLLTEPNFVISRTLILAGYGFFIDAPAGNAFYTWMDKTIHPENPKSAKSVGTKIAIDQLIYAPIFTVALYVFLETAHLNFAGIPLTLQDKVIPTLLANWTVWPLAHGLNFYFVPTEQRILYNNFVAVCWTTWLSYLAH